MASELIASEGDTSTHGGTVTACAEHTFISEGGPAVAFVGSILKCPIHGVQPIITGAANTFISEGGPPVAINGSRVKCDARIIVVNAQNSFAE